MEITIPSFLAERGITSTSANHLANIGKEMIQDKEAELANIQLHSTTVELLNGERKVLHHGYSDINRIQALIEDIARIYSFNAWVREAIKAKETILRQIDNLSIYDYCQSKHIEYPKPPESVTFPTADDVLMRMSIKERNEYYTLEAYAATYGKHIHRTGDVSMARQRLQKVTKEPAVLQGQGRDAIVYSYEPTVSIEAMDQVFFELQKRYRENEARLNAIKAEIADTIKRESLEMQNRYKADTEKYNAEVQRLQNDFKTYQLETRAALAKLKIVLPDRLLPIYEELNTLGKQQTEQ